MAAIAGDLVDQGVKLEPVRPGAHEGVCERKQWVIQDRYRAVKNGLWFVLPLILVRWLVYYYLVNMLPSHQHFDLTSLKENFTGRNVTFDSALGNMCMSMKIDPSPTPRRPALRGQSF